MALPADGILSAGQIASQMVLPINKTAAGAMRTVENNGRLAGESGWLVGDRLR
jgi:hypothetical protein